MRRWTLRSRSANASRSFGESASQQPLGISSESRQKASTKALPMWKPNKNDLGDDG